MGRLVVTHSTHVEGLIPLLRRLAEVRGVKTVTPAVLSRVRGRSLSLSLRISTPISGGYKLVARRGGMAQEVFVVTALSRGDLQSCVDALCACSGAKRERKPR